MMYVECMLATVTLHFKTLLRPTCCGEVISATALHSRGPGIESWHGHGKFVLINPKCVIKIKYWYFLRDFKINN